MSGVPDSDSVILSDPNTMKRTNVMAPLLVVHVLAGADDDFYEMLDEAGVAFTRRLPQSGVIMNAGDSIEVLQNLASGGVWIGALATVIVKWIKARSSRKVIVTTKENEVVHVFEGMSAEEIERILKATRDLAIIDTEPKSKIKKR